MKLALILALFASQHFVHAPYVEQTIARTSGYGGLWNGSLI